MPTRRVWGVLFTDAEQNAIRKIVEGTAGADADGIVRIEPVLRNKLETLGCIHAVYNDGTARPTAKIFDLKEELDEPLDQWDAMVTWFRTRKWAIPFGILVITLPLVKSYIEMIQWVINAISGTPVR